MEIIVNGAPHRLATRCSIRDLIAELGLADARIAVELNREIVPRHCFEHTRLKAGDRVEIVRAVGG
ncbi:MAG: sulfur carrier protein ThiS, partial [Methylococcales bacterium]